MNYEAPITTQVKAVLDLIDLGVSQEERGVLERQLDEDDLKLAKWLAEESSKPSLVRDLKREQIAAKSLTARIEAILKPVRESKQKSAAIIQEREQRQAAAREACGEICKRAHADLTKALNLHGVRAEDMGEAVYKILAYSGVIK